MRYLLPLLFAASLALYDGSMTSAVAQPLSLEDAFAHALRHNRNLLAAEENVRQADLQRRQAWTIMGPTVDAQASHSWQNEITSPLPGADPTAPALIIPPIDGECPLPDDGIPDDMALPTDPLQPGPACVYTQMAEQEIVVRPSRSATFQLSANQPLFVGALIPALQAAANQRRLARHNLDDAREQVLYNVANLYFNTVAAQEFVALQEQSRDNLQAHLDIAETRFEVGETPRMGVLQASIELRRAEAALTRARNDERNARAALANLIGMEDLPPLQSAAELVADVQLPDFPDDPLEEARRHRSDLLAARTQVDLARDNRNSTWWQFSPSIFASGNVQRQTDPGAFGDEDTWTVMLMLNVPLIDRGSRIVSLQESQSQIRQAEILRRATSEEVRLELQTTQSQIEVTRQNLGVAHEQVELAEENFEITTLSFEHGLATSLDVIDANQALLSAHVNLIQEQFNLQLDTFNYFRAMGLLLEHVSQER